MLMAGLYIHIPYCSSKCYYCAFYSKPTRYSHDYTEALLQELRMRANEACNPIETIYFGGGTPSILPISDLKRIFECIYTHYAVATNAEITLEANPDHLTNNYVLQLRQHTPINRVSVGIQSFADVNLQYLGRKHNAAEAQASVLRLQDAGYSNLSVDLIYGIPTSTPMLWEQDLQQAIAMHIPHISAYSLTIEENTVLEQLIKQGKRQPTDELQSIAHYNMLLARLEEAGYEQYEISNFCQPDCYSRHNRAYWQNKPYIGIGAAAHSYNGEMRSWNVSNTAAYIQAMQQQQPCCETEQLTLADKYNEYVMTSLRTKWGCNLSHISTAFGLQYLNFFQTALQQLNPEWFVEVDGSIVLTSQGKLFADKIAAALFYV